MRTRIKPDGTVVDHDNQPVPDQTLPAPFPGVDEDIIALFVGIGLVGLVIGIIIGIWGAINAWSWALSALPPAPAVPEPAESVIACLILPADLATPDASFAGVRLARVLPTPIAKGKEVATRGDVVPERG